MFAMPTITKTACVAIIVTCMIAATAVYLGNLAAALNMVLACVILLAGTIALNL